MKHYARRLPHRDTVNSPLFVTFRLHDRLPFNRVFPPEQLTNGQSFVAMDRLLGHARTGPMYLRQAPIADLMVKALQEGETRLNRYQLHA